MKHLLLDASSLFQISPFFLFFFSLSRRFFARCPVLQRDIFFMRKRRERVGKTRGWTTADYFPGRCACMPVAGPKTMILRSDWSQNGRIQDVL